MTPDDDRRLAGPGQDDPSWAPPGSPPYPLPGTAPPAGYPYLPLPPLPPPLPGGVPRLRPVRIDPVPGTSFGIAIPALNPTVSGLAVGSMVAGIGSILVSLIVVCSGISRNSSGVLVGGAFAALAATVGLGALGAAFAALREIRGSAGQVTGRGLAITGLACGAAGFGLAVLGMLLALALSM